MDTDDLDGITGDCGTVTPYQIDRVCCSFTMAACVAGIGILEISNRFAAFRT